LFYDSNEILSVHPLSTVHSFRSDYDGSSYGRTGSGTYGSSANGGSYHAMANTNGGGYGGASSSQYGSANSYGGDGGSSYQYNGAPSSSYGGNDRGGGFRNSNLGNGLAYIDFSKTDLVPFEKDFYIEHPDVTKRSEEEAQAWRASKQMTVEGQGVPKPCMTFEEASMPEYILNEVLKQGFDRPTPIQSQGWPMALKGKNMVGISATGSGKTLAFLLPAMIHINAQVRD
jgi:ATP-dependent RNA helicase DDX5/DBP2